MPPTRHERVSKNTVSAPVSQALRLGWKLPLFVFVVILTANLAQHLLSNNVCETFSFDGRHYLDTCAALTKAFIGITHGDTDTALSIIKSDTFKNGVLFDGPVVVTLPAIVFALCRHVPAYSDWRWMVLIYSVFQSTTAAITAALAMKLTRNARWAVTAGLIFGLYPASLANSGRYLSEVPTTMFLSLFLLFIVDAAKRKTKAVAAGICGGIVALAKPALVPAVLLTTLLAGIRTVPFDTVRPSSRLIKVALTSLIVFVSLALPIMPWYAYTKIMTGTGSITAQRLPVYNAAVGTDRESDGWCTLPDSEYVRLMTMENSPVTVLMSQWGDDPWGCAALALKRVTRMFAYPFNNFRQSVFGLPAAGQQFLHSLLVTSALFGICLYLVERIEHAMRKPGALENENEWAVAGDLSLLLIGGHLVYVLFQAMARYAYSAVPLLCLFAVVGTKAIYDRVRTGGDTQAKPSVGAFSVAVSLAVLSAMVVFLAEPVLSSQDGFEVAHVLAPGDQLEQRIDLSSVKCPRNFEAVLLLVDGSKGIAQSTIEVNGHVLKDKLLSMYSFDSCIYGSYALFSEFAHLLRVSMDDFRQWRAVVVSKDWLKLDGDNIIKVRSPAAESALTEQQTTEVTIYGQSHGANRRILSPNFLAYDRLLLELDKLEPRIRQTVCAGGARYSSTISGANGKTDNKLSDICSARLAVVPSLSSPTAGQVDITLDSAASPEDSLRYAPRQVLIQADKFPLLARDLECNGAHTSHQLLKALGAISGLVKPDPLPECTHIDLRLNGRIRITSGVGKIGILLTLQNEKGRQFVAGRCPDYVSGKKNQWIEFSMQDRIPLAYCGGKPQFVGATLYPCPAQDAPYCDAKMCSTAQIDHLVVTVEPVKSVDLLARKLIIF